MRMESRIYWTFSLGLIINTRRSNQDMTKLPAEEPSSKIGSSEEPNAFEVLLTSTRKSSLPSTTLGTGIVSGWSGRKMGRQSSTSDPKTASYVLISPSIVAMITKTNVPSLSISK